MNKLLFFCFLLIQLYFVTNVSAQQFELRGQVTDSLRVGIAGATVQVVTGSDSLRARTDENGHFSFRSVPKGTIQIAVRSMGYRAYQRSMHYTAKENGYQLPSIILYPAIQQLEEVQVKAPDPIRVAKDTVEYNAAAYTIGEHDRLEDLLRQLPGISIDANGNVTAMGESITKLRVNGKDFFTNNVKDFLQQLPAGIIAKLQVIDDYGDQANFTGVKVGKPQKMLNLVIKDGQNKGIFGDAQTSANTQNLFGAGIQGNVWLDVHQLSAYANSQKTRTEGGNQQTTSIGTNYRRSMDKSNVYGNYGLNMNQRTGAFESYTESGTSNGILYNRMENSNDNENQDQQVQFSLQSRGKKDFWNFQLTGQRATGKNETHILSKQTGAIVQDLDNTMLSDLKNRSGNLSLSWSRNMQKLGRNLNASFSGSVQGGQEQSAIQDQLSFYDQATGESVKDSVSIRLLDADRGESTLGLTAKYTEPLNDHATAEHKRSLDIGYDYSFRTSDQVMETNSDQAGVFQRIDSLSTDFRSVFSTHQLELSYRVDAPKLAYSLGLRMLPVRMHATEGRQQADVGYTMFNLFPIASIRYAPSLKNSMQLNYTATASAPSVQQLMPLQDVRNLQQVTIGNPNLKPTQMHRLSLNLGRVNPVKGHTYNLTLSGSIVQDQVVSNVLLLPDTLHSLKQETHYVNANGAYNLSANYDVTLPFAQYYQLRWGTYGNKNRSMVFVGGQKGGNSTISLRQSLSLALNRKKIRGAVNLSYDYANSSYELNSDLSRRTYSWDMGTDARWTISPRLIIGADGSYRINAGYSIPIKNPILINAYVELFLFAKKELSMKLHGYDLLDQQQSVNLLVTANSITQQTSNRVGRYVLLTLKYNLSRFGG
ncbi:hypothetical protein KO02_16700 [Sphingobacterium sp. ML3W]|uniref:TonB-dependent receptor n=1 Tax=Sphingobacterium sp. ML3W TaxID=1538644 RepID=UPI0004F62332|nr:TonB-dependent receptor [Sphingobacterium sp. ML3W]AIM38133.1 hypothetical protein KO02_16700 [Sphingobacterium sp. ML3W]